MNTIIFLVGWIALFPSSMISPVYFDVLILQQKSIHKEERKCPHKCFLNMVQASDYQHLSITARFTSNKSE